MVVARGQGEGHKDKCLDLKHSTCTIKGERTPEKLSLYVALALKAT